MGTVSDALSEVDFADFIYDLDRYGWFEYVFPFMLVYAIVLTILNNVDIFKERKSVRVIISLVISLFSIAFEITDTGETLGDLMMVLFPGITAFSMGVLALYIVVAMLGVDLKKFFGDDNEDQNKWILYILGGLGLLVVVYYYAKGFGWDGFDSGSELREFIEDPMLYILIIFGAVFWFITKEDTPNRDEEDEE